MATRKFHRYLYELEVLSEEELPDMDLAELAYEITDGQCSGVWHETKHEVVDGPAMAGLLQEQGSDPEFFMLTPAGDDLEDS